MVAENMMDEKGVKRIRREEKEEEASETSRMRCVKKNGDPSPRWACFYSIEVCRTAATDVRCAMRGGRRCMRMTSSVAGEDTARIVPSPHFRAGVRRPPLLGQPGQMVGDALRPPRVTT
jgi:hypothetical protein